MGKGSGSGSGSSGGSESDRSGGDRKSRRRSGSRDRRRDRSKSRDGGRGRSRDKDRKKDDRSRSRSEKREASPTYSTDDLWRRLEYLGTWKGLGKKEKMRPTLNGAEADDLKKLERKVLKRLEAGYRTSCIRSCLSILEMGYEVPKDLLGKMMAQVVQRPGVIQVCMSIKLLQILPSASIPVESFLRGLGVLVQRNAPVQLVRMWLNLALPRDARPLKELPHDYDPEEKGMAEQELEDSIGVITDDEEDEKGASRSTAFVTGCKARPELNGRYLRSEDISAYGRPVYEKTVEKKINRFPDKGKGKGKADLKKLLMPGMMDEEPDEDIRVETLVIHYRKENKGARNGWWMSRNTCGGEGLAWNARETKGPPAGGWFIIRDRNKLPDPIRIVDPKNVGTEASKSARKDVLKALGSLDPNRLKARIVTPDNSVPAAEYFGHFCMLMHLEHLEELRQIKRRTTRLPEAELQRLGWAMDGLPCTGVFGRREPKRNTNMIGWEDPGSEMGSLCLPPNTQFDRFKFKRGDSVTISESKQQVRRGEQLEKIGEGFIADMRPQRGRDEASIVVRLRGCWPDDALTRRWRIDKGANSTLYERQLQALLNLLTKARPRVSELLITAKVGAADSWAKQWRKGGEISEEEMKAAERAAELAEKELKQHPAAKLAKLNPGGADSDKLDRALAEVKTLTHLNQSQRDAVRCALRQTCTIIQGPPGTGKTHVSVQIMKMWSKTLDLSPLLATSDSNVAVDNIAMGLRKEGVKAVRVGRPDKINRILEEITLECLLEKEKEDLQGRKFEARFQSKSRSKSGSPDGEGKKKKDADAKKKKADKALSKSRSPEPAAQGKGKGKGKGKGNMKHDFELQMRILQDADVICTTTISSGGDFFSKFAFAGVLVDEAAQATELAAVVPLILRGTQRLVLVGDQCQLPPTVQSSEAEERGLSLSLYSRLVDGGGLTPFLLDTQYRSHPIIAEFSARTFYAGKLKSGVVPSERKQVRGLPWPRPGCPIGFVECQGEEQTEGESKFNPAQAEMVCRFVQDAFYQRELEVTEIGVVTPYVSQVRLLKRMIKNMIPEGTDPELLEVASVDNFQGREKDLIIFSSVRSNRSGTMGFLADWRRLNVMLTRARRGLLIVGNSHTLKSDEHWAKWLEFYGRVASGRARTPSPERVSAEVLKNETEDEKNARLKKERTDAARKLSMAIRFPGLAMAQSKKKEETRERSRSWSPGGGPILNGSADSMTVVKGGRTRARAKTPSPERKGRVVKETGIGKKQRTSEFAPAPATGDGPSAAVVAKAKAKAKAKVKLAIASDDDED